MSWCPVCKSEWCPGCESAEAPQDLELESLEATPEGQDWKSDQRDATPEPPAYLDPHFILRNRRRAQQYLATGEWTWPKEGVES